MRPSGCTKAVMLILHVEIESYCAQLFNHKLMSQTRFLSQLCQLNVRKSGKLVA